MMTLVKDTAGKAARASKGGLAQIAARNSHAAARHSATAAAATAATAAAGTAVAPTVAAAAAADDDADDEGVPFASVFRPPPTKMSAFATAAAAAKLKVRRCMSTARQSHFDPRLTQG